MPSREEIEQQIVDQCAEFITAEGIAKGIGRSVVTVRTYLLTMKDRIHRFEDDKPWMYLNRPASAEDLMVLERIRNGQGDETTAPLLPQGPLSFLAVHERYTPKQGRKIEEKHGSWIGRRDYPHIGCGSSAYVDMNG